MQTVCELERKRLGLETRQEMGARVQVKSRSGPDHDGRSQVRLGSFGGDLWGWVEDKRRLWGG